MGSQMSPRRPSAVEAPEPSAPGAPVGEYKVKKTEGEAAADAGALIGASCAAVGRDICTSTDARLRVRGNARDSDAMNVPVPLVRVSRLSGSTTRAVQPPDA